MYMELVCDITYFIIFIETFHKHSTLFSYTFKVPNLCKGRLMHLCMQLQKMKNKYFGIIN